MIMRSSIVGSLALITGTAIAVHTSQWESQNIAADKTAIIAQDSEPKGLSLLEGEWSRSTPRDILGRGSSHAVRFRQLRAPERAYDSPANCWTATFHDVFFGGVRSEDQHSVRGPLLVMVDADSPILTTYHATDENLNQRMTFAFSEDAMKLYMPALVETEPGSFLYVNNDKHWTIVCEHDPREVPLGTCRETRGRHDTELFYTYQAIPRPEQHLHQPHHACLRLFRRDTNSGLLIEFSTYYLDDHLGLIPTRSTRPAHRTTAWTDQSKSSDAE